MNDLKKLVKKNSQAWIKWENLQKNLNNSITLYNVEMYGEVFSDCLQLDTSGFIYLDLTEHFIIQVSRPYIIKMTWNGVISQDKTKVLIKNVILEDQDFGFLHKLVNNDRILLDCSGHTTEAEEKGKYKLAYRAMVYNELLEPYDYIN